MKLNKWPPYFRARIGGRWPSDYTTIDIETSGYSPKTALPVEIGWVEVRGGVALGPTVAVINWFGSGLLTPDEEADLERRLEDIAKAMQEKSGIARNLTADYVRKNGRPPVEVANSVCKILTGCPCLVGHNFLAFDENFLVVLSARTGVDFPLQHPDRIIDTASVEKASYMEDHARFMPLPAETCRDYFGRIVRVPVKGLKFNLDPHCRQKYAFDKFGLTAEKMHGAGADAMACHILIKAWTDEEKDNGGKGQG